MAERDLERRLAALAHSLDADVPAFDASILRRRGYRRPVAAVAVLLVVIGAVAAPGALSGLRGLLGIDSVRELGPVAPDVAPAYLGTAVPVESVAIRIASLGRPDAAYERDDFAGGMESVVYGAIRLSRWRADGVAARVDVVRASGRAIDVTFDAGRIRGVWVEAPARGALTVTGADGARHRETFDVGAGALVWRDGGFAYLLQGASGEVAALELGSEVAIGRGGG